MLLLILPEVNNHGVLGLRVISGHNLLPSISPRLFLPGSQAVVSVVNRVMNHSLAKHPHISHRSSVRAPQRSLDECPFKSERSHGVSESTPLRHRSSSIRSSSSRCFQPPPRHGGQPLLAILVDSGAFLDLRVERTDALADAHGTKRSSKEDSRREMCSLDFIITDPGRSVLV